MDKLKFVGGAIVVVAAFAIMMPGFFGVFMGMGRILLYITCILLMGGVIAFILRKVRGVKSPSAGGGNSAPERTDTEDEIENG